MAKKNNDKSKNHTGISSYVFEIQFEIHEIQIIIFQYFLFEFPYFFVEKNKTQRSIILDFFVMH